MPASREFIAGLLIGVLGSFLGSLAASFLQAYFAKSTGENLVLFVICFLAFGGLVWGLYRSLMKTPDK